MSPLDLVKDLCKAMLVSVLPGFEALLALEFESIDCRTFEVLPVDLPGVIVPLSTFGRMVISERIWIRELE